MELRASMMANPTRVAIEELQLQDLKNIDAAVEVKQKASPPRHEAPMVVRPPAIGRDINSPIVAAVELVVAV